MGYMRKILSISILALCLAILTPVVARADQAVAIERAKGDKLAGAVGHFARARRLLLAAVEEFDRGHSMVNPDALLDSKEFRDTLMSRAQDLERVLDPQPRVTKGGVRFEPDPRLLGEANK
jgi:hypothetical protein